MKNSILILAMLFFISSCNNDEEGLITENATVYYYLDPMFGGSFCEYVIETESHRTLVPAGNEHGLEKLFGRNDYISKVKITYRITKVEEIKPSYRLPCKHKGGDLNPVVFIKVIRVVKIK